MQASWMLIKAQLKNKKGGYISIFILTLVIGLMLSLSLSLVVNINSAARDAIEASNFGDLYMNFNPDYVPTDEDFDKLRQMPEFAEVMPLKKIKVLGKPANIIHADGEKTEVAQDPAVYVYDRDQLSLRLFTAERTAYLSGDQAVPPPRGEVYIPVAFTAMYNAKPGDRYVMAVEEETFEYKVAGFVEDITQINMVSIGEHNVYMNQADFDELQARNHPEFRLTYTLHLYTADAYADCDTNELFRRIEDSSGLRSKTSFFFDDEMFVRFASTVSYMVLLIVIIFVVVMFIAGLAILNFNIYSSVEAEYRNIGVMKAVGLKNATFKSVYLLSYPAAIVAGLLLGSLIAIPLLRMSAPLVLDITGLISKTGPALGPVAVVCLILLAICLLLILWQLRKIGKIKPYRALSEGKQAVYGSSGLKIKLTKPFFRLRLSLKQLTSSVGTYLGSVFVITLLFFFLLVGLSTTTLLTPDQMMEKYWGFDWDVIVAYRDKSEYEKFHNEVDKIVRDETKVDDSYVIYQYMINGLDQNIGIFALEEEYIDRMISLIAGNIPRSADELAIGKILADANNLKIGDEIELSYGEQKATYKISGLFQTINNIGRCVTFTTPALERLMGEAYADDFTQIYYVLEDQSVCEAVVEKVNESYPDLNIISVIETWKSYGMMSDAFNILPVIIFGFAVVFIIISSLQLAEKIFNREQIDFGIMKAVGFRNGVSRQIFSLRFVIVSVVGLILGAVVFRFAASPLLNTLVGFMGLSQVPVQVPMAQVLISALAMSLIFWLVAYFTSRKIKRLKVRDLVVGT